MKFEKKMKIRGMKKLDSLTPELYKKPAGFPLWAKIAIPVGAAVLAGSIALAVFLPKQELQNQFEQIHLTQLAASKVNKISQNNNRELSASTYNSYVAFAKKFSILMMEENNKENEESLGISIPDAYICLAITAIISSDAARQDVLSYLELNNVEELRTAVREVISVFGVLYKDNDGELSGGYNLNSIWLNPEKVRLIAEKDEQLYKDLEEVFDATIYNNALTSDAANQYLKTYGLKDMPTPEVKLDDPSAMNVMSVYYCMDYFRPEAKEYFHQQYLSKNHKMDYKLNGQTQKVDYINTSDLGYVYEGDNFYGATMDINKLGISFFLPNDETALPSTIFNDVINDNYHFRETTYFNIHDQEAPTYYHNVNISAPYFSLDNCASLENNKLKEILPVISRDGAGTRLAELIIPGPMYLDYIKQFSVMKFNYNGFYSCSITVAGYEGGATGDRYQDFDLNLSHPYVFKVSKMVEVNNTYSSLPIVVGEIVNPNYTD